MPRIVHLIDHINPQLAEDPTLLGLTGKLIDKITEHTQSYRHMPVLERIVTAAQEVQQIIIISYQDKAANGYWYRFWLGR